MFNLYYANTLAHHKTLLVNILAADPNPDPFAKETILVQSVGMAQWLQRQIAQQIGVAGHLDFPYPTSFLWQQYRVLFPALPKENLFARNTMIWRLMRLIPAHLSAAEFAPLARYLTEPDQQKCYQLAEKMADLFDQYLVYRPHWLVHWENGRSEAIFNEICHHPAYREGYQEEIRQSLGWQGILWNALVAEIRAESDEVIFNTSHRAYLQQRYFDKLDHLTEAEKARLPQRLFVFGISAMPPSQLAVLKKLSEHCQVHLFFTNPSEVFWGDQREDRILERLALNQTVSEAEIETLLANQGNPLLATWGKQGKAFLNQLLEQDPDAIIPYYATFDGENLSLLQQVKAAILHFEHHRPLTLSEGDRSIQFHACHSKMREVEVLHNQLLAQLEQDPSLTPKDIIVMSPDIDSYAPYIDAVFSRYDYSDRRYIPFALSDQKISRIDPIIAGFLRLLALPETPCSAEEVLDLLNIQAVRAQYQLSETALATLRDWIQAVGIRFGLRQANPTWQNYNSWENGLNRLLLGTSLKAEHGTWQSLVAFDESYGLSAELVGVLANLLEKLTAWQQLAQCPQPISVWQSALHQLRDSLFLEEAESSDSLLALSQAIEAICEEITAAHFDEPIALNVLAQRFSAHFTEQRHHVNFLVGKVNFCTLLPMRAIPFKVVCMLGMNEGEFPRQPMRNSFDLMQYAPQKGDRSKRDDDRYLFLEALLSAEQTLYISYIGQSLTSNQPKLPSILVTQLRDYLSNGLGGEAAVEPLSQRHPMTPFSPANFDGDYPAYDEAWLQATEVTHAEMPFLCPLPREPQEWPTQVSEAQLVNYLQDPYRFFFHTHLGVKFEREDARVEESERFSLSGLDSYHFYEQLLPLTAEEEAAYFERAKLAGALPACHFGELAGRQLSETIQPLKQTLAPYLAGEWGQHSIEERFCLGDREVRLSSDLMVETRHGVVGWRVGRLRDRDLIAAWVRFLLLQCQNQPLDFRFYFRQETRAGRLRFAPIGAEEAKRLLQGYLADYLDGYRQLSWVVNQGVMDYLTQHAECDAAAIHDWLVNQDNLYLQRVLMQGDQPDIESMHQRTLTWFGKMAQHAEISEV